MYQLTRRNFDAFIVLVKITVRVLKHDAVPYAHPSGYVWNVAALPTVVHNSPLVSHGTPLKLTASVIASLFRGIQCTVCFLAHQMALSHDAATDRLCCVFST